MRPELRLAPKRPFAPANQGQTNLEIASSWNARFEIIVRVRGPPNYNHECKKISGTIRYDAQIDQTNMKTAVHSTSQGNGDKPRYAPLDTAATLQYCAGIAVRYDVSNGGVYTSLCVVFRA